MSMSVTPESSRKEIAQRASFLSKPKSKRRTRIALSASDKLILTQYLTDHSAQIISCQLTPHQAQQDIMSRIGKPITRYTLYYYSRVMDIRWPQPNEYGLRVNDLPNAVTILAHAIDVLFTAIEVTRPSNFDYLMTRLRNRSPLTSQQQPTEE